MRFVRFAVVGVTLAATAAAADAQRVLIVNGASGTSEPGTTASITTQLTTLHTAVGNTVDVVDVRPADLTPYRQVWDIRFSNNWALTGADQSAYLGFLQGGGGMFVMGENSGFQTRNNSVFALIAAAGGGTVAFGSGSASQTVCSPFNDPNPVGTVNYAAPGWFTSRGTGQWISAGDCNAASGGSGIAFAVGTLANAQAGALTTILDVNFMQTSASPDNVALTRNLIGFVGNQVNPIPEPSTVVLSGLGLAATALAAYRRRRPVA
jgi:hypothetical protein